MKKIKLPNGIITIVSDKDFEELNQYKWWFDGRYPARHLPMKNGKRKTIRMHQQIMGVSILDIDHKNGNSLDNQRTNLRFATRSQNNANMIINNFRRGVVWHKLAKKWQAQIQINGKNIYLGLFKNLNEAIIVRKKASKKYYGEFAR